jgi:hypothetical protein
MENLIAKLEKSVVENPAQELTSTEFISVNYYQLLPLDLTPESVGIYPDPYFFFYKATYREIVITQTVVNFSPGLRQGAEGMEGGEVIGTDSVPILNPEVKQISHDEEIFSPGSNLPEKFVEYIPPLPAIGDIDP